MGFFRFSERILRPKVFPCGYPNAVRPRDPVVGDVLDGDILFAIMGGFYLLAAPAAKRSRQAAGTNLVNLSIPNVAVNGTDPNDGFYNTSVWITRSNAAAAHYCNDRGYFLPNKHELEHLWQQKSLIDSKDASGGAMTLAAIAAGTAPGSSERNCWSSTENSSLRALARHFGTGAESAVGKNTSLWVLPCRRVQKRGQTP